MKRTHIHLVVDSKDDLTYDQISEIMIKEMKSLPLSGQWAYTEASYDQQIANSGKPVNWPPPNYTYPEALKTETVPHGPLGEW